MLSVMPSTSGHNYQSNKVKKEGGSSGISLSGKGFVTPLYVKVLPLFNYNGGSSFPRKKLQKSMTCAPLV